MKIQRLSIRGVVVFCAVCGALLAAPSAEQGKLPPLPAYSAEKAFAHLEQLVGRIGPRIAGTEAEGWAADYIASQFRSWGLETQIQPFPVPVWREAAARLWAEGDQVVDFPAKAIVFGGLTPAEGIAGEFVDIGNASPRYLNGKDLKGKIVLVKRDVYLDYPDYQLTDRLISLGVAGVIFHSGAPHPGGVPTAYYNYKRSLKEKTPPSVDITYEDAVRLALMKPKRVGLTVTATIEWKQSRNVIGEIKGSQRADEIVIVSAHNDSAHGSPGAADDAAGVACVMELARVFAAGPRPVRTFRFIAWGAEELGLMGSEAYLRARTDEVSSTVAMIYFDGWGSVLGTPTWRAAGGQDWLRFLHGVLDPTALEATSSVGPSGMDVVNFAALEVPTITFGQTGGHGHHTRMDDLGGWSPAGLEDALLMAVTLGRRLADQPTLGFSHDFPPALLQEIRDYAARWGWGVRPEANLPPKF